MVIAGIMALIHKSEILERLRKSLRLDGNDTKPKEVASKIIPTINCDIDPSKDASAIIVEETYSTTNGSTTIYTTPSDKDFFLTSASMNYEADATADSTNYRMTCTPYGSAAKNILRLQKITLTATGKTITQQFNPPIRIKRGTNIQISHSFSAGVSVMAGSITGFVLEPED